MTTNRRAFIKNIAAVASALPLVAQESSRTEWGGPVVDCHHHPSRTPEANIAHLDGSGISNAMVLARDSSADQITAVKAQYPGWVRQHRHRQAAPEELLTNAAKSARFGFGELSRTLPQRVRSFGACMRLPLKLAYPS